MAWFQFGGGDISSELAAVRSQLADLRTLAALNLGADMATNDELTAIRASLTEASTEIPAKLEELLAAVEAGDPADPALVAQIRGLASGLADIVPNAPTEPEAPVDETPAEPVTEDGGDIVADEPTA